MISMVKVPLILFPIIRARLYISSELSEDSHKTSSIDLFVRFDSLCPINNLSVINGQVFLG